MTFACWVLGGACYVLTAPRDDIAHTYQSPEDVAHTPMWDESAPRIHPGLARSLSVRLSHQKAPRAEESQGGALDPILSQPKARDRRRNPQGAKASHSKSIA